MLFGRLLAEVTRFSGQYIPQRRKDAKFSLSAFAQTDRGTITGTISDPVGAVVASVPVQVKNLETGAAYEVGTSATGNYVVQVPTGNYELSVTVAGFKRYVRPSIAVPVAQTLRIDITLEVDPHEVVLLVSDNGAGFEHGRFRTGHFGLRTMCERAQALGGTLVVESADGAGTRVRVRLPRQSRSGVGLRRRCAQ